MLNQLAWSLCSGPLHRTVFFQAGYCQLAIQVVSSLQMIAVFAEGHQHTQGGEIDSTSHKSCRCILERAVLAGGAFLAVKSHAAHALPGCGHLQSCLLAFASWRQAEAGLLGM